MIRAILKSLLAFFIVLALLVGVALSPMGLRLGIDLAAHYIPGELHVQKTRGSILGPLSLSQVDYTTPAGVRIQIKHLSLHWHPIAWLRHRHLMVKDLHLEHVTVTLPAHTPHPLAQWQQTDDHTLTTLKQALKQPPKQTLTQRQSNDSRHDSTSSHSNANASTPPQANGHAAPSTKPGAPLRRQIRAWILHGRQQANAWLTQLSQWQGKTLDLKKEAPFPIDIQSATITQLTLAAGSQSWLTNSTLHLQLHWVDDRFSGQLQTQLQTPAPVHADLTLQGNANHIRFQLKYAFSDISGVCCQGKAPSRNPKSHDPKSRQHTASQLATSNQSITTGQFTTQGQLTGLLTPTAAAITLPKSHLLNGQIQLAAHVQWFPKLHWAVAAQIQQLTLPKPLQRALKPLKLDAPITVTLNSQFDPHLAFDSHLVDSRSSTQHLSNPTKRELQLGISIGKNHAYLHLNLQPTRWQLSWQLAIPRLAELVQLNQAHGSMTTSGTLALNPLPAKAQLETQGQLMISALRWESFSLTSAQLHWQVHPSILSETPTASSNASTPNLSSPSDSSGPSNSDVPTRQHTTSHNTHIRLASTHPTATTSAPFLIQLQLHQLKQHDNTLIDTTQVRFTGDLTQLNWAIDLTRPHLESQLNGQLIRLNQGPSPSWRFTLQKASITNTHTGTWTLNQAIPVTINAQSVQSPQRCWTQMGSNPGNQVCLSGSWQRTGSQPWRINLTGQLTQLGPWLQRFLPQSQLQVGAGQLTAQLQGTPTGLNTAQFSLRLPSGTLTTPVGLQQVSTSFQSIQLTGQFRHHHLLGQFEARLSPKNHLQASIDVKDLQHGLIPTATSTLSGHLQLHLANISWLSAILPQKAVPSGQLTANMQLQGTLGDPGVSGQLRLINGRIRVPDFNTIYDHIRADLSASGKHVQFKIEALSKGHPFSITGHTTLGHRQVETTAQLTGKQIQIINTNEFQITASPDIHVHIHNFLVNLTGNAVIDQALFKPQDVRAVVHLPEPDTIIIGLPEDEHTSRFDLNANLHVTLGPNVHIQAMGLSGQLLGAAALQHTPSRSWTLNGKIFIKNGQYSIYGQTLKITDGSSAQFIHSPPDNPLLSVKATRVVNVQSGANLQDLAQNNIVVGVSVEGSLKQPKIDLFSSPANLSKADILSYLVLGYASGSQSAGNWSLLVQALNSLGPGAEGIGTTGGIISDIQKGLGLSELGVETETTTLFGGTPLNTNESFVVGKHLTKRIYVRYQVNLGKNKFYNNNNVFTVRYLLSKRWFLQGDYSSVGRGIDLLYTVETN